MTEARGIRWIGAGSVAALIIGTLTAPIPRGTPARWTLGIALVATVALLLVALLNRRDDHREGHREDRREGHREDRREGHREDRREGQREDKRAQTALLTVAGLGGAVLDLVQPRGLGLLACYVALAGLGLALRPRAAVGPGLIVLAAAAGAEAIYSSQPILAVLNLSLGALFMVVTAAFAAASRDARARAEALAAEEHELRLARQDAAVAAERARIARELHDILAHTLSGLSLQLAAAQLLARREGADDDLITRIESAHRLTRDGMANAKGVVSALRGDALPGPGSLPRLVEELRQRTGLDVCFISTGEPRRLTPEAGLAVFRTAQEALTNAGRYGGPGVSVTLALAYDVEQVTLTVVDEGGDTPILEPGHKPGYGLVGLAERAALHGGRLEYGPVGAGWRVELTVPAGEASAGTMRADDVRAGRHEGG
jgi:signal transduction histidine kinase